jgi:putative ATP-dependent endonuclease of the OLD family
MSILIEQVRVFGFRGLQNLHVNLEKTTVLTGMNNTGKTSFLKAMQIALGNSQFITQDDFNVKDNTNTPEIVIDIKVVPVDKSGVCCADFDANWEVIFKEERIRIDGENNSFVPLRTIVTYDQIAASYKSKQYILPDWPQFEDEDHKFWHKTGNGKEKSFHFEEIPFYYMDAQRDILEDIKMRSSYLGKMISKIEYKKEDIKQIEEQIKLLNEQAVSSSPILSNIKTTLKELNSAMDTKSEGVDITPFTKKIRDLNKGLTISYSDKKESFPMEYHGMGTRSWSSLLTLKAFINLRDKNAEKEQTPFFPILAIEEPEAHLHPNAQKKLYNQIDGIKGQKIISTHSPYIASSAELFQIRNFYKDNESLGCGAIDTKVLTPEELRKIERQVINTRGELFFSKVIVFFEGETEEQALPIFAKHFLKVGHIEAGIDFIGVGGFGNYLPFLRVAESLKIPWFIYSDAEANVETSVKSQFNDCKSAKQEGDVIVFLSHGNNFEKQLIADGYIDEIRKAIVDLEISKCYTPQHVEAKKREIAAHDNTKIMSIIECAKTQFGPLVAEAIIESKKPLPPSVTILLDKIVSVLERRDVNE